MKYLNRFNENKKAVDKEVEQSPAFDVSSLEDDSIGFKSELEMPSEKDEIKIKKEIQATTPGLKKSIKKFEDFTVEFEVSEEPSYSGCGCCDYCTGNSDCACGCPECGCEPEEEPCDGCDCVPCECRKK